MRRSVPRGPISEAESRPESARKGWADRLNAYQKRIRSASALYRSIPDLALATGRTLRAAIDSSSGLVAPYSAPKCIVNSQVTRRRRIVTQALDFARVKAVSKAAECTLNDVMLALCGAALRRYLDELGELPKKSLTGGIPVGLKHQEGAKSGNSVSLVFTTLGTDVRDPLERLMTIRNSTRAAKDHLMRMSETSRNAYSVMMLLPAIAGGALGSGRVMCNVPVSNVPGPRTRLYLAGATLEAAYPTSVLIGNVALGVTCVSYDQGLFVGIVACPDVLPHAQKLGPYIGDAFAELEAAVGSRLASRSRQRPNLQPRRHRGQVARPATGRSQASLSRETQARRLQNVRRGARTGGGQIDARPRLATESDGLAGGRRSAGRARRDSAC